MAGRGLFAASATTRYAPFAGVHATRECDTVVRMSAAPHGSLLDVLGFARVRGIRLAAPSELGPHVWLEASMRLDAALSDREAAKTSNALFDNYCAALEAGTANVDHEFFTRPVLSVIGVWVGEQDILSHMEAVAPHPLSSETQTSSGPVELATPVRALLVVRAGSRQDESALLAARAAVTERLGTNAAVVLRLGDEVPPESPESLHNVVLCLAEAAKLSLLSRLRSVSSETEKARRATRPSFKSWFGVSSTPKLPTLSSSLSTRIAYTGSGTSTSNAGVAGVANGSKGEAALASDSATSGGSSTVLSIRSESPGRSGPTHRRRTSSMNGFVATPLFPEESVESLSRHTADLLMLSGDYEAAGDAYRLLASEVSGLSGPACVHEASAVEHASVALALADGSKREVGGGMERAIRLYCKAGRRELAVRAALRAADYCLDAGFPDSGAGVLDRALSVAFPNHISSRSNSAGSFSESAAAILLARTSFMFSKQGLRRKASLYAYMAASKLSNQAFHVAAGLLARDIDSSAICWSGIRDEVELIFGRAAIASGDPEIAVASFSTVMSLADDATDVEVQSRAILGFFEAVNAQGPKSSHGRWDKNASFPIVTSSSAVVETIDSSGGSTRFHRQEQVVAPSMISHGAASGDGGAAAAGSQHVFDGKLGETGNFSWKLLEDDVLGDWSHFEDVFGARACGKPVPKRERSVDTVVAALRREKESGSGRDPGGSLEMKIQRMREAAETARRKRREASLLDRGAVVGEEVTLSFSMRNPLQFPVFVEAISAVVSLDGQVFSSAVQEEGVEQTSSQREGVSFMTVDDVVLMPMSSSSISVSVICHRAGCLRFIGARWMFSVGRSTSSDNNTTTAPGFCVLDSKGPRLNRTRKQRASEVPLYAEDTKLVVQVIPPAPRLELMLTQETSAKTGSTIHESSTGESSEEFSLRAGQKLEAALVIRNVGQQSVERMVYRAGSPRAFFLDVDSTEGNTVFEAVEEEGSQAALSEPTKVAGCISSRLGPGESLRIPVWLFGPSGGKSELRMVVAYGSGMVRVCRLKCSLNVRPSVNVFPRFIRRYVAPNVLLPEMKEGISPEVDSYLLGIEVEHSGKSSRDDSYHVSSVSVTSSGGWRVRELPGLQVPSDCESLRMVSGDPPLRINETATVFVVVYRPGTVSSSHIGDSLTTSVVSVGVGPETTHHDLASKSGDASSFHTVNTGPADERDEVSNHHAVDSAARASKHFLMTSGHARDIASTSSCAAYLSLKWKSSAGDFGELYLPPLDPADWVDQEETEEPLCNDSAASDVTGDDVSVTRQESNAVSADVQPAPVAIRVVHKAAVAHTFQSLIEGQTAKIPAVVPVDLYIRNLSSTLIDATISAPVAGGIADGDRGRFWAGIVDGTLRAIPPETERRLCLSAILDGPGSFDLAKLVTSVRRHRGLGAGGNTSALRTSHGEVRVGELLQSNVYVADRSGSLASTSGPPGHSSSVTSKGDIHDTSGMTSPVQVIPETAVPAHSGSLDKVRKETARDGRDAWDSLSSSDDENR